MVMNYCQRLSGKVLGIKGFLFIFILKERKRLGRTEHTIEPSRQYETLSGTQHYGWLKGEVDTHNGIVLKSFETHRETQDKGH